MKPRLYVVSGIWCCGVKRLAAVGIGPTPRVAYDAFRSYYTQLH